MRAGPEHESAARWILYSSKQAKQESPHGCPATSISADAASDHLSEVFGHSISRPIWICPLCANTLTCRSCVASTFSLTLSTIGNGDADFRLAEMTSVRRWRIGSAILPESLSQLENSSGLGRKCLANFPKAYEPCCASRLLNLLAV